MVIQYKKQSIVLVQSKTNNLWQKCPHCFYGLSEVVRKFHGKHQIDTSKISDMKISSVKQILSI